MANDDGGQNEVNDDGGNSVNDDGNQVDDGRTNYYAYDDDGILNRIPGICVYVCPLLNLVCSK